jgi:hypothetical protein
MQESASKRERFMCPYITDEQNESCVCSFTDSMESIKNNTWYFVMKNFETNSRDAT